jgi:hypothetical protein
VEIGDHIVSLDQGIQKVNQVEKRFVQIDLVELEPLADKNDHRSAESVDAALIQTADARDFRQILRLGSTKQALVTEIRSCELIEEF